MKLAIGTVQFGLDYGISNNIGITGMREVELILREALDSGIQLIDTAACYGESEKVIGESGIAGEFDIVTKTKVFNNCRSIKESDLDLLQLTFQESLSKLKVANIYCLMIHQISDLLKEGGERLYHHIVSLKEKGLIKKTGISIYSAKDIDFILNNYNFDVVQLPVNIFDQRLIKDGSLRKLKASGLEIHVRSAFLQGLIFMKPEMLDKRPRFNNFQNIFKFYHNKLKILNVKPAELALSFLNEQPEIDNIICGVNNLNQLKEVILSCNKKVDCSWVADLGVEDEEIINPLRWLND